MEKKIVILGTGPTGLGAAWRLQELGYKNFKLFEKNDYPGGLASSFVDEKGFTWDIGGHVQFSHYKYFDELMDYLLKDEWLYHERESWVWIKNRFVPYPFQNNIRHLPKEDLWRCLSGLIEIHNTKRANPRDFREWCYATFGKGISEIFMLPYNFKVWAYSAEKMSYSWIGERVAVTDLLRVMENVILDKDDVSWGPNNKFRFPLRGGTGEIWRRLFGKIDSSKVFFRKEASAINSRQKQIKFSDGSIEDYDVLISTIPLDIMLKNSDFPDKSPASNLIHSSTHIIGIGLKGKTPEILKKKCWMYFPESNCPFYRVTVFSNYSPNNVPDINIYWSLMLEVSESPEKKVNHKTILEEVIQGAINTKLISLKDQIISRWHHFEPYGYPTPSLHRDESLRVLRELEKRDIYSRGRFGAWKYEVSNQDHCLMQGVEIVNRLLNGKEEFTLWKPEIVNLQKSG